MEGVFMERRLDEGSIEVVIAKRGEQVESEDPNTRMLVLYEGRRYEGVPGTPQFRVIEFAEHGIPYRLPSLRAIDLKPRAMRFRDLFESSDLEHVAERQWRMSVPISTVLLAFLAVPLARSRPREGRYGRMAVGLLVFIIYFNLLSAAKAWVEEGAVPAVPGMWWVHGVIALLILVLLSLQNGWHRRLLS